MMIEIRTYTFRSGTMVQYLRAFERIGFSLQKEHLGDCVAFLTSASGPIEQVVQIFRYKDWSDREARRAALYSDERFKEMSLDLHPLIQSKESQLFREAQFTD